ncbi:MAG: glycosyltransferase family 4 protein [Chloroflexota bacterium]
MRIAQLAPTFECVPPAAYGGTELVVHLVTEELVRRGHDVTLFATGDSRTSARLESVTPVPYRYGDGASGLRHAEYVQLANAQACFRAAAAGSFDIVHNHAGIEGLVLAASSATPVLTTVHNDWTPETAPIWEAYPWFHVEVSAAHAARHPVQGRLPPVHHGLPIDAIVPRLGPGPDDGYLLFLGRFTPTKGPEAAIAAARLAGRRLILAGKVDSVDDEWYAERIVPQVDGDQIQVVGEVRESTKERLLTDADALLFPISWDEPFGLVIVEALAAGTPVLGFARGSVPELVDNGVTGWVVDDVEQLASAIGRIKDLDRAACRAAAERRFTVGRMVDDVLDRYSLALSLPPTRPIDPRAALTV